MNKAEEIFEKHINNKSFLKELREAIESGKGTYYVYDGNEEIELDSYNEDFAIEQVINVIKKHLSPMENVKMKFKDAIQEALDRDKERKYTRDEVIELCGKAWDESLQVNKYGKDKLYSNNLTTEPVHFIEWIKNNIK